VGPGCQYLLNRIGTHEAFFPSLTHTRRAATGRRRWSGCSPAVTGSGGEGARRRRRSFSAASCRYSAGGGSVAPGTGGDLRGCRGRRARRRARERGKHCLGRCWGSFQGRRAAFYRREREHGVKGSAAGARPVSATGGTRRSGISAEGCSVLWRAAGALAGCGVVWCRGGK
jgi:hypothetical protein